MAELGIHSRDLRVLDPALTLQHPAAVLCRERVLLLSLEHIKAAVTPSHVLALNVDHPMALRFLDELQLRLCAQVACRPCMLPGSC
jgi:magnesium transporter